MTETCDAPKVRLCCNQCGEHQSPSIYRRGVWVACHWPGQDGLVHDTLFVVAHAPTGRTVLRGLSSDNAICAVRELSAQHGQIHHDVAFGAELPNPPPPEVQDIIARYRQREQSLETLVAVIIDDLSDLSSLRRLPWLDPPPATPATGKKN